LAFLNGLGRVVESHAAGRQRVRRGGLPLDGHAGLRVEVHVPLGPETLVLGLGEMRQVGEVGVLGDRDLDRLGPVARCKALVFPLDGDRGLVLAEAVFFRARPPAPFPDRCFGQQGQPPLAADLDTHRFRELSEPGLLIEGGDGRDFPPGVGRVGYSRADPGPEAFGGGLPHDAVGLLGRIRIVREGLHHGAVELARGGDQKTPGGRDQAGSALGVHGFHREREALFNGRGKLRGVPPEFAGSHVGLNEADVKLLSRPELVAQRGRLRLPGRLPGGGRRLGVRAADQVAQEGRQCRAQGRSCCGQEGVWAVGMVEHERDS
jgi:hypothetical protein